MNLVYLSPNPFGGWVTFTAHLIYGIKREYTLRKCTKTTERKGRDYGYGLKYQNTCLEDLLKLDNVLITAVQKNKLEVAVELLNNGAHIVIHDPTEFYILKEVPNLDHRKIITIRKSVKEQIPDSTLIPHPYKRTFPSGTLSLSNKRAVSIARIDFDKNTDMILRANKGLKKKRQIEIHGFENRLYGKFKLAKEFPEWMEIQSTHKFDREKKAAVDICHEADFAVDLSVIQGDGGGTQYTFMEAMDAGCINILHQEWIIEGHEMVPGKNCFAAADELELRSLMLSGRSRIDAWKRKIVKNTDRLLGKHASNRVVKKVFKVMGCV